MNSVVSRDAIYPCRFVVTADTAKMWEKSASTPSKSSLIHLLPQPSKPARSSSDYEHLTYPMRDRMHKPHQDIGLTSLQSAVI